MIPEQGPLNETSPIQLMLAIHEQGQTGILYFRQNEILKVFYLNRGRVSWSISSDEADKLDHVLLGLKLIDPNRLAPYQAGNKIAESFGKVLVENSVITLETLIQATREQVRGIITSVLHWRSGSYQLVQEPPPTRMVSLDMDTPALVFRYIVEQMDMNLVWDELGALSGRLQWNSDPGKKNLYTLDAEQQGVISRFRDPQRLETVLQDFPAEGKFRILKIIYYLLLTGLLVRTEPEKSATLDFKELEKPSSLDFKELDNLFSEPQDGGAADVDIEMPAMIDESAVQEIPYSNNPEIESEREPRAELETSNTLDLLPPESLEEVNGKPAPSAGKAATGTKDWPGSSPFRLPEKPKPHWRSITFISMLLALALLGLFLWLTRSKDKPAPADTKPAAVGKRTASPAGEAAGPAMADAGQPAEEPAGGAATGAATAEPPAAGSPPPPQGEPTEPMPQAASDETTTAPTGSRPPLELFQAGNFRAAGDAWRGEILAHQVKFSILLEMDCLKDSVQVAYQQIQDKGSFFLLNKVSRDGRNCWLVLWGRYRTASEAELGMTLVPEYFKMQSHPPSVVELAPYL